MLKKVLIGALSMAFALSGVTTVNAEETPITATGTQNVVLVGEEWGAGVTKTIINLDQTITGESVSANDFVVEQDVDGTVTTRTVVDAYVSDANGNEVTGGWWRPAQSNYITIEMAISPTEGNPIVWNNAAFANKWASSYKYTVTLAEGEELSTTDDVVVNAITVVEEVDIAKDAIKPQLENVTTDTYTYETEEGTEVVVPYGFYQPNSDGHKNGIIIWNHGLGEGGTDPQIAIFGNEVTALFDDEFQNVMDGCYVVVPQVPIEGFAGISARNADRADAIVQLVKDLAGANSDIDLNRVYVAGCSMGGAMTSVLISNHADFFAAAVPICPASTPDVEAVKDLPMWFIHAENDTTVRYNGSTKAVVPELREAGAEVHTSIYPNVVGTYTYEDGTKAEYDGHWSWVYFFNNECVDENGVNCWEWLAQQTKAVAEAGTQKVEVIGEEWGAGVTKTIITLDKTIDGASVSADDFEVVENADGRITTRTIVDAYVSDADGNEKTASRWNPEVSSQYITIELAISPTEGNPIIWNQSAFANNWAVSYKLYVNLVEGAELTTTDDEAITTISIASKVDVAGEDGIKPQLENVTTDTYTYTTAAGADVVVPYGFYQPNEDGHKNAIVIWKHGMGEGGTDPLIAMLGNEVTALFGDEFQEVMDGAYVVVPQVPGGASRNADRATAIVELVKKLAAANPDMDLDRVIVTGCSAGGGMTSTLVNNYADFFAAALPICPAGSINVDAVGDLPLWYIHAENDGTVRISGTNTNVAALREAGKEVHTSIFPNVIGTYTYEDGTKAEYDGHWSWVYFFNNECYDEDGVNAWEWMAQQTNAEYVPGTQKVEVIGEEWGAGVTKTIVNLDGKVINANSIQASDFSVVEVNNGNVTTRTILDAYPSDENGNKVEGNSAYVTIELAISPSEGNPIVWDGTAWRNNWGNYKLYVNLIDGERLIAGEETIETIYVDAKLDVAGEDGIKPQLENVVTDTYTHKTEDGTEVVVPYGFYTPEADDHTNAIVIWNHGVGEGGSDPQIAMLGNEVTALFGDEFQEVMNGAYVVVPQVPSNGSRNADRATAIVELVKELAAAIPDMDLDRVIVTGCSAGGGMTSTLVNNYADFFAAALPICPAGSIDPELVGDLPLWYIHAENDGTVNISGTNNNVAALREAGKEVHTSIFPNVVGTYTYEDGTKAEYDGHWSWVYFFNNECYDEDGVNAWEWMAQQTNAVEADTPSVTPTPEKDPTKTGDNNVIAIYAVLALAAAGAYVVIRRKENN